MTPLSQAQMYEIRYTNTNEIWCGITVRACAEEGGFVGQTGPASRVGDQASQLHFAYRDMASQYALWSLFGFTGQSVRYLGMMPRKTITESHNWMLPSWRNIYYLETLEIYSPVLMLPQVSATKEKIQYSIDDKHYGKICEEYLNKCFAELGWKTDYFKLLIDFWNKACDHTN